MLKSVLVLFATVVMVAAGDPVGPQPLLTMDQCGALISDDCRAEFKNANVNKNLDVFYYRCANEKGDKPLRTRCSLCCGEESCAADDCSTCMADSGCVWKNDACVSSSESGTDRDWIKLECTVGTCDFYDEVKNFLTCDNPTYAKGHGQPYCDKFDDAMDELDDKGKKWVMESRECEQRAIMKAVENHETSCEALEKLSYEWREECNDDAKFCWRIAGEESNADVLRAVYGVDPAIGASQDCKSENTNADNNNDMASFYRRCDTEGAANPLRSRCKYCEWVEGEIKRCKK